MIKKNVIRILILITVSLIISLIFKIQLGDYFINTIYTVSGILFSVGFGLIISNVNLSGVKNKVVIDKFRGSVDRVRNSYILYFLLSTIALIIERSFNSVDKTLLCFVDTDTIQVTLNISLFASIIILHSVVYYIINFMALQRLNNKIFDEVNRINAKKQT